MPFDILWKNLQDTKKRKILKRRRIWIRCALRNSIQYQIDCFIRKNPKPYPDYQVDHKDFSFNRIVKNFLQVNCLEFEKLPYHKKDNRFMLKEPILSAFQYFHAMFARYQWLSTEENKHKYCN